MERDAPLPAEFGTTMQAASTIAKLTTRAERYHYFDQIPAHWQPIVMTLAVQMIAAAIIEMPRLSDRRLALARAPDEWRETLCSHVARLWKLRELKAKREAQPA